VRGGDRRALSRIESNLIFRLNVRPRKTYSYVLNPSGNSLLGPLHTIHNLGRLYVYLGKLDEAEKMHQRALQGHETVWGPDHTSTLDTVDNLGLLYADQGKLGETEKMHQRALQGFQKAWGRSHIYTRHGRQLGHSLHGPGQVGRGGDVPVDTDRVEYEMALAWQMLQDIDQRLRLNTIWNLGDLFAARSPRASGRSTRAG
jgi:tetratricopeptide (TPR) repeat protein